MCQAPRNPEYSTCGKVILLRTHVPMHTHKCYCKPFHERPLPLLPKGTLTHLIGTILRKDYICKCTPRPNLLVEKHAKTQMIARISEVIGIGEFVEQNFQYSIEFENIQLSSKNIEY